MHGMSFKQWLGACRDLMFVGVFSLTTMGCERGEDYSRHFKHSDDPFYKGTYVVRETASSIFSQEATDKSALRMYRLLDTDIEGIDHSEHLAHLELLKLREQGFRIIVR